MKFTIERAVLLRALGHVQSVVERRNTIPILSNIHIEATDDHLALTATDMDIEIAETVPAQVAIPGKTTIPAHTLHDIVRKLREGAQIEVEVKDGQATIRSGRSSFSLSCLPAIDYPSMSAGTLPHDFLMPSVDLKLCIDKVRFAISTEETRYYLNGIYFHVTQVNNIPFLRSVATDGHRMARVQLPVPEGAQHIPGVIIPRKTIQELRKLLDDTEAAIRIELSETKVRFHFDDATLTSKLIDGTFPDYERVIPTGNDKQLDIDAKLFGEAVDRVATISSEKTRAIKLAIDRGSIVLSATSPENGTASEEIEADYANSPLEIGFNSRYLLDINGLVDGPNIRLVLSDAAAPVIIMDAAEDTALWVLMPMRC